MNAAEIPESISRYPRCQRMAVYPFWRWYGTTGIRLLCNPVCWCEDYGRGRLRFRPRFARKS